MLCLTTTITTGWAFIWVILFFFAFYFFAKEYNGVLDFFQVFFASMLTTVILFIVHMLVVQMVFGSKIFSRDIINIYKIKDNYAVFYDVHSFDSLNSKEIENMERRIFLETEYLRDNKNNLYAEKITSRTRFLGSTHIKHYYVLKVYLVATK